MPPSNGSNLARRGEIPSSIAHETSKFRIVENRQPMTTPLLLEPCCSDTFSETYGPSNRNALLPFPDLRRSFAGVTCAPATSGKDKKQDKKAEAQALLDQAAKLTNIEGADGQPFSLLADTTWTEGGKTVSGQIGLAWQARERHREEVTFPGFLETTVVADDELRRLRSTAYVPLEEMHWLQMLQFWHQMNDWGKKNAKIDNSAPPKELAAFSNISCVIATYEVGRDTLHRRACFDTANGWLLLLQQRVDKEVITQTFSSYGTFGNKEFPFEISYQDTAGARGE